MNIKTKQKNINVVNKYKSIPKKEETMLYWASRSLNTLALHVKYSAIVYKYYNVKIKLVSKHKIQKG